MGRKRPEERLLLVKALFGLGLSCSEIANLIGICAASIYDDLKILGDAAAFPDRPKKPEEVYQNVFRVYAERRTSLTLESLGLYLSKESEFEKIIAQWLGIEQISAFFEGVARTVLQLKVPGYPKDHLGYAKLIGAIFDEWVEINYQSLTLGIFRAETAVIWNEYFCDVAETKILAPRSRNEVERELVVRCLMEYRSLIMPNWPDEVYAVIDKELARLQTREEEVLRCHFGIGQEFMTLKAIGEEKLHVGQERVRQIEARALRKLRHPSRLGRLRFLVEPVDEIVKWRLKQRQIGQLLSEDDEALLKKILGPEKVGITATQPASDLSALLLKRVADLDFSVRVQNCLEIAGIVYLGELVQKTEQELSKTRHFGRKSLREVKQVLAELGLSLREESQ
ncbi:MAG: DNA-directed RNA polymerase subunit alpha C-terminal domain-containing protein [Patescibacteria group bacterium]